MSCKEKIKALEQWIEHLHYVEYWCWKHDMIHEAEKTREAVKELLNELEKLKETCK